MVLPESTRSLWNSDPKKRGNGGGHGREWAHFGPVDENGRILVSLKGKGDETWKEVEVTLYGERQRSKPNLPFMMMLDSVVTNGNALHSGSGSPNSRTRIQETSP